MRRLVYAAVAAVAAVVAEASTALPEEYQQVEYIESDGNQCVDSEYWLNSATTRIECRYSTTNYGRPDGQGRYFAAIFGVEDSSDERFFVRYNDGGANIWVYWSGGKCELSGTAVGLNTLDFSFGQNYSFDAQLNDTSNKVNLNLRKSPLTTRSLRLFSCCYQGTWPNCPSAIRMMYFRIWEGEDCVRDLVPCYRKGTEPLIAGLYDLANDKFYTNAVASAQGAGFAVGKDVTVGVPTVEIANPSLIRSAIGSGTFDFSCSSENFSESPTYLWYVDGGDESVAEGPNARLTFDSLGHHTVKVVAESDSQSAESEIADCVNILGATIYVNGESTNPVHPFATPETATRSPKEALATAVIPGCEIVVAEGTYLVDGLKLYNRVTLRSEKGAARTWFVAQNCANSHLIIADADYKGGGTVDGFTIDGSGQVGALSNYDGAGGLTLVNSVVTNCRCGAVYFYNHSNNIVSNCLFVDNVATEKGAILRGEGGSALFTHCVVRRNRSVSEKFGGILNDYNGVSTVRNCLFTENVTDFIGGENKTFGFTVNLLRGTVVENCTIVSNCYSAGLVSSWDPPSSTNAVGFRADATTARLRNCIVWNNYVKGVGVCDVQTSPAVTYACSSNAELTAGEYAENHNTAVDPMFVMPARGNYHVGVGSPVVDAGQNQPWMAESVDLDGKPRIHRADRGGVVDLGCYEKDPAGLLISVR